MENYQSDELQQPYCNNCGNELEVCSCHTKKEEKSLPRRKVIVAGSRDFTDYSYMKKCLNQVIQPGDIIISGTARGADKLGERYAKENDLDIIRMPADWNKYGKSAGYKRNVEMAKIANLCCVFWDGKSRGSKNMIDIAYDKYKLNVKVFRVS